MRLEGEATVVPVLGALAASGHRVNSRYVRLAVR